MKARILSKYYRIFTIFYPQNLGAGPAQDVVPHRLFRAVGLAGEELWYACTDFDTSLCSDTGGGQGLSCRDMKL